MAEHGNRKARLASLVSDLGDDDFVGWLRDAVEIEDDLEQATAAQAEAFEALIDAYGTTDDAPVTVTFADDGSPRLVTTSSAEAAVLAAYGGSKADALAAAKDLAALHGRPKPRSVATAASDPVLTALLIADV